MTEAAIVRTILRKLNAVPGVYARKTHGGAYSAGWPDLIVCYQGHLLALEVKRPGGILTRLQASELERWSRAGATAAVVTNWADVEQVIGSLEGTPTSPSATAHPVATAASRPGRTAGTPPTCPPPTRTS